MIKFNSYLHKFTDSYFLNTYNKFSFIWLIELSILSLLLIWITNSLVQNLLSDIDLFLAVVSIVVQRVDLISILHKSWLFDGALQATTLMTTNFALWFLMVTTVPVLRHFIVLILAGLNDFHPDIHTDLFLLVGESELRRHHEVISNHIQFDWGTVFVVLLKLYLDLFRFPFCDFFVRDLNIQASQFT